MSAEADELLQPVGGMMTKEEGDEEEENVEEEEEEGEVRNRKSFAHVPEVTYNCAPINFVCNI